MEHFGRLTFNKKMMKQTLPYPIYLRWKEAVRLERDLDRDTADAIAHAMKDWAIAHGATHYSHWFQPLNGLTAHKQEAFLDRNDDLEPMNRFSGKELIKGEPDASSFPSGGMRSTFEARGYTYWDPTANSFIIDEVLYIPTIFVSYTGEVLDKRAPLLSSTNALSEVGTKICNILEKSQHTYRMRVKVGLEQEFFLVDKALFDRRSDLKSCGRTLIGAKPPKAQELDDHYFGSIPKRVQDFYRDVDAKLWDLGIYAKTEHNEVAPCQFELAILFENVNVSVDNNQLCMEVLKEMALKHGMVCLLHEKPFANVNGSGKHNNYSITTNYGLNCFDPGDDPEHNLIFLLFTSALIEATDKYAPLLRLCSSSPSNDYRLGGSEAPPAIISMFLGNDLESLFLSIANDKLEFKKQEANLTVNALGKVPKDTSDRNRTSTMAFTGNKFEFRMLGSSRSAADINIVLNSAMADVLGRMLPRLEKIDEKDLQKEVYAIVKETVQRHGRVLFGGDNYSEEWKSEAKDRALPNYPTYFDALKGCRDEKMGDLFKSLHILTDKEIHAIFDIGLEDVVSYHGLEARILLHLLEKDVLPSLMDEIIFLGNTLSYVKNEQLAKKQAYLNDKISALYTEKAQLEDTYRQAMAMDNLFEKAQFIQKSLVPQFTTIRTLCDETELHISRNNYRLPTYEDMFSSLR